MLGSRYEDGVLMKSSFACDLQCLDFIVHIMCSLHNDIFSNIPTNKARQNNDFASFAPSLKDCFDTAAEIATLQRGEENKESVSLYSQMLDEFETGMSSDRIDDLFNEVQSALVPFIAQIRDSSI